MPAYYPIFIDIQRKKCVVVGGGEVAERKVSSLVDHGALVTVIASRITGNLTDLANHGVIQVVPRDYQHGDLQGAVIAVAATNDALVNRQVAREASERGVLTNIVDSPEESDFIVPSLVHRGDMTIAISTGGKSPALARKLRTQLEIVFGPEYATLAELVSEVRQELKRRQQTVDAERWQEALDLDELVRMIREGQLGEAKKRLIRQLTE